MGAPKKKISFEELKKLCVLQCTLEEVAGWFDVDEDTVNARIKEKFGFTYSVFYKKHSQGGKVSLRRLQFKSAEKGNVTMLIWLGKQWLGQKDRIEKSLDDKTRQTITLNYKLKEKIDEPK